MTTVTVLVIVIGILFIAMSYLRVTLLAAQAHITTQAAKFDSEREGIIRKAKFRSSSVNWGLAIENFAPFIDKFPLPPEDVTFLGKPIDFVGYKDTGSPTKCSVHFIEVKSGKAFLSTKQKNIKKAIAAGRVHWHEVRVAANTKQED